MWLAVACLHPATCVARKGRSFGDDPTCLHGKSTRPRQRGRAGLPPSMCLGAAAAYLPSAAAAFPYLEPRIGFFFSSSSFHCCSDPPPFVVPCAPCITLGTSWSKRDFGYKSPRPAFLHNRIGSSSAPLINSATHHRLSTIPLIPSLDLPTPPYPRSEAHETLDGRE